MPYGSPANAVALATVPTPATIKTNTKRTNNGRGIILVCPTSPGPTRFALDKARIIPFGNAHSLEQELTGSPITVVRSGRKATLQDR